MTVSMTGFGKSEKIYKTKKISVEIRTLNSKSIEIKTKTPSAFRDLDLAIRKTLNQKLQRGKIDCNIYIEDTTGVNKSVLNKQQIQAYYDELRKINKEWGEGSKDYLSMVLSLPDIFSIEENKMDKTEEKILFELINKACEETIKFRNQEGKIIEQEFVHYIGEIQNKLILIEPFEKQRTQKIKKKIINGLKALEIEKIDKERLEQELLFYIEKLDISEEKSRLQNHLNYFLETMKTPNTGKKLGFITQEIGREINTLGSKSNHAEMQKIVVEMKDSLEKIKEQILNTL